MQSHFFQRIQNREHVEGLRTFWFERIRALLEDSVPNLTNLGIFRGHLRNFWERVPPTTPERQKSCQNVSKDAPSHPIHEGKVLGAIGQHNAEKFYLDSAYTRVGKIVARKNEKKSIKFGRSNSVHEPIDCNKSILEPYTAHGLTTKVSEF